MRDSRIPFSRWVVTLCAVCVLGLLMVPRAAADSISFDLTVPNSAMSGYPAPYASVTVTVVNATTATITVTGLSTGGYQYLLGSNDSVAFNTTTPVTIANVAFTGGCTGAGCPAGGTGFSLGSGNVSTFGTFAYSFSNTDGFTNAVTSITITLNGNFTTAAALLMNNGSGYDFAAHVFATGENCDGACVTGYVANGTPVPEPASMALLGSGLLTVGGFLRKRFKK